MLAVLPFPKAKVAGPNILGNGTFDDASGWTLSNATISGGTLNFNDVAAAGGTAARTLNASIPAGSQVRFTVDMTTINNTSSSSITINGAQFATSFPLGSRTYVFEFTVPNAGSDFSFFAAGPARGTRFTGSFDNMIIQILS